MHQVESHMIHANVFFTRNSIGSASNLHFQQTCYHHHYYLVARAFSNTLCRTAEQRLDDKVRHRGKVVEPQYEVLSEGEAGHEQLQRLARNLAVHAVKNWIINQNIYIINSNIIIITKIIFSCEPAL